jgi:hypothetical protein
MKIAFRGGTIARSFDIRHLAFFGLHGSSQR